VLKELVEDVRQNLIDQMDTNQIIAATQDLELDDLADILNDDELRKEFIEIYSEQGKDEARNWINSSYGPFSEEELAHRMSRYGLNP